MENLLLIDSLFLMPLAGVGLVVAIVLLILRRKKRREAPARARIYLKVALLLILFAIVVFAIIPFIYFVYMLIKVGPSFIYAGLKSL